MKIKEYFRKIPKEVLYTIYLFLATRVALTVIGLSASSIFDRYFGRIIYINYKILNIWGGWDTTWYINIAQNGYSSLINIFGQANYGFFPLYPIFIKIFSFIFQNYFVSGLIVSNLFLILSSVLLYKLARIDCDEKTSLRAIKYLFFFPGAFALSLAMSESIFLFFLLACFYLAKKQKWLLCGISGIFLTMTKPFGIVIIFPMLYEYVKAIKKNKEAHPANKQNFMKNIVNLFCVMLAPLGLVFFSFYTFLLTGDFLAYPHIKYMGWGNYFENPIDTLASGFMSGNSRLILAAGASVIVIAMLIYFYEEIGFSYFLIGILLALFGICYANVLVSTFRYYTAIFPIYIILAKITNNENSDSAISSFLLLLQGYLMIFWRI